MSDSLTDAQQLIADVLDRLNVGSYTDHGHLAVEIDKALGGLVRDTRPYAGMYQRGCPTEVYRFAGGWTPEEPPNA